jgi:hypothetical protein
LCPVEMLRYWEILYMMVIVVYAKSSWCYSIAFLGFCFAFKGSRGSWIRPSNRASNIREKLAFSFYINTNFRRLGWKRIYSVKEEEENEKPNRWWAGWFMTFHEL